MDEIPAPNNDWNFYQRLGQDLYKSKQYEPAINAFKQSLSLKESWQSYQGLGWTLSEIKQFEPAIDAFKQSLALNKSWKAYQGLGWALTEAKRFEPAIDAFKQSLALNKSWKAYQGLGWALYKLKQYELAIEAFQQSLSLNKFWFSYQGLGWALYNSKQYEPAIDAFKQSLALSEYWKAYQGLGWALSEVKQFEPAIDAFKQSLALNKHWKAYQGLGWALYNSKRYESAINTFKNSLALKKSWQSYQGLGWALYNSKQYESAINAFKNSLALKKSWQSYQGIGWALYNSKQYESAINAFKNSLALKKSWQSYQGLGLSFSKLGKINDGTEAMCNYYALVSPRLIIDPFDGLTIQSVTASRDMIEDINAKLLQREFAFHPSYLQLGKDPVLQSWKNLIHIHIPKCAGTNFEKPLTALPYCLKYDTQNNALSQAPNTRFHPYLWHGNLDGKCNHDAFMFEAFRGDKSNKNRGSFLATHGSKHSMYSQNLQETGSIIKKVCLVRNPSRRLYSHIRDLGRKTHSKHGLLRQCIQNLSNIMDRYIYDYSLFEGLEEAPYCKPTDYQKCESIDFIDISDNSLISKVKSSFLSATSLPNIVQFNRFHNDKDKPAPCSALADKDFKEILEELTQRGFLERDNLIDLNYLKARTKKRIIFPKIISTGTELHPITIIFLKTGEIKKVLTKDFINNPINFIN